MHEHAHYHKDERGLVYRCYHRCRISSKQWAIGLFFWTISFPFEHLLWEKAWPFYLLSNYLGI